MTAFLKIDRCQACQRDIPWEWVPPVPVGGSPLPGTGVWRSPLVGDLCSSCYQAQEAVRFEERRCQFLQTRLIALLGGPKPCREFTFERFQLGPGNELAFRAARPFNPAKENLYFWGRSQTGKTHLAYAIARACFLSGVSIEVLKAPQLVRKLRMKPPEEEQRGIDHFVQVAVLVLDDLGLGQDTAYARQVMQEVLDGRDFSDRAGLVIASRCSLRALAARFGDDAISQRLGRMCRAIEMTTARPIAQP